MYLCFFTHFGGYGRNPSKNCFDILVDLNIPFWNLLTFRLFCKKNILILGPQGDRGTDGKTGSDGPRGSRGQKGEKGEQGLNKVALLLLFLPI